MIPREKLAELKQELKELHETIADPAVMSDSRRYRTLTRRFKELSDICAEWDRYQDLETQIEGAEHLAQNDAEMAELAREELAELEVKREESGQKLRDLLIPSDPNEDKNAIVEIRAGTGGEEAALFVADLYRMYSYYAEQKGWKLQLLNVSETGLGGFKEIIFMLSGEGAYGLMRFESGVHRVQRIPVTESGGRIHTSAVSVAVLPEAEDIDIDIAENDLRIDVYRSSGHGGQSVNTTDSAVRITHVPTGIVVTCQDEKSQIKNKAKAMKVLRSRLLDAEISKQEQEIARSRKAQVSTGDRSAKIRTYNFPQSRVTDHRINLTSYNLDSFLAGNIEDFIQALRIAWRNEKVNA
ncbi:MAG: peptide chain release factor 1 [Candidatus Syntrophosphaera sp.]|jgi:peptide chain release factor 1